MSRCGVCGVDNPPGTRFCGGCGQEGTQRDAGASSDALNPIQTTTATHQLPEITVGAAADCDIVLSDPTVSGHHLRVRATENPDLFQVDDLDSRNGTFLNGRGIQAAEVGSWDVLQLGMHPLEMAPIIAVLRSRLAGSSSETLTVGREPEGADLVVPYPVVSTRHAEVRLEGGQLGIRDLNSTNGTRVDGRRLTAMTWETLGSDAVLQLGTFRVPRSTLTGWMDRLQVASLGGAVSRPEITLADGGQVVLGRDPSCDVPIDSAQVSWHHARITARGDRWIIKDLNSRNGTFLNGSRIRTAQIHQDDQLYLGPVAVQLSEGKVSAPRSYTGEVRLDAHNLMRVFDNGHVGLDDVSVSIYPGELVALMGPSGAGKTTLLELLTGQRRPTSGSVLFNGQDLHDNIALFRDRIGYVPQEDVMHRDLTVFEVLYHSARLRLPRDLPKPALIEQVDRLITKMGLAHVRDSVIGGEAVRGISGGQRKRVNIAIELITEPPMLFLDEPTSGLDSTATLEVLRVLKTLADQGKTIVMTIHQPRVEAYRMVDNLLLLAEGGKLAWYGPADPGPAEHFAERSKLPKPEHGNPADYVIDVLAPTSREMKREPEEWKREFLASTTYQDYVVQRQGAGQDVNITASGEGRSRRAGQVGQFGRLLIRYALRKWKDKSGLAIQMAQAPIVAFLLMFLFLDSSYPSIEDQPGENWDPTGGGINTTLFLLAAASFWFGCSNVARELVSDRAVFRRERMAGLAATPYLASIFSVQAFLAFLQTLVMLIIVWPTVLGLDDGIPSFVQGGFLLFFTAMAGIGLGLLVSSLSPTEVTAIAVIPILLLPQLMLAGYLSIYEDMAVLLQAASFFIPLRWAFQGLTRLQYWAADQDYGPYEVFGFGYVTDGVPSAADLHLDLIPIGGILLMFSILFISLTWLRLLTTRTSS